MDAITWPLEFLEFLRCCRHRGARTLVFGGFAVSMHARPRTTGDLDLWCGMDPANWERRVEVETDGTPISFLDRESLIASKAFAGRPQDLADLEQLRRAAGGTPGDDR